MAQEAEQSAQLIPIIWMNVSLIQDATQGANWDFAFPGHNGGVHGLAKPPHKLDVTALLASFDEPRGLKPAFNLAKWQGLSRPNLNLDRANFGGASSLRRLEVKFKRFLQIGECLFLSLALAGDVDFETLSDIPVSFTPDGCGK